MKTILKDKMEHAADLLVPLIADMHTGQNWYEANDPAAAADGG